MVDWTESTVKVEKVKFIQKAQMGRRGISLLFP
jgi:hypothetical protein